MDYTYGPAVVGQCRSGIGPRRSASDRTGIGSGGLRHARMGIKNKSNYNKTTLVALLTYLLLGDGICASSKLALANISTRSTSAEGRGLSWYRLCRRWWHSRLSKWQPPTPRLATGCHRGDYLFSSVSIVSWEYIACSFTKYMTTYHKVLVIYMILLVHNHWWWWIVNLAVWLSLLAPWVVIMTTHGATGDCGVIVMMTFDFRWRYRLTIYHELYVCVIKHICKCISCKSVEQTLPEIWICIMPLATESGN